MYNDEDDDDGGWLDFLFRVFIALAFIRMLP